MLCAMTCGHNVNRLGGASTIIVLRAPVRKKHVKRLRLPTELAISQSLDNTQSFCDVQYMENV